MSRDAVPVVTVTQFEQVVPRGKRSVTWFVPRGEDWKNIAEVEGAKKRRLDPRSGVVWETQIICPLPLGTRLMRVDSRPLESPRRDALEYLMAEQRNTRRKVFRHYFRVGQRGDLERIADR